MPLMPRPKATVPNGRQEGFAARSASGFILFLLQSVIGKIINLAAQLVLAYLLVPEDFGLIGLAYTVTALTSVFGIGGVKEVLIQKYRRWNVWVWPGMMVACLFGLAATAIGLGLAPLGAHFYGDPRLLGMVSILAFSPLLQGIGVVPQALLQAQLRFRASVVVSLIGVLMVPILTVLLAWRGYGAYSFAWPVPIAALFVTVVAWWIAGPMPPMRWSRRRVKAMALSSSQLVGVSFAHQFINQFDYVVLGRIASAVAVGQYFFAFNLSTQSLRLVVTNFTQVLLPVVVQISDDTVRTRSALIRVCQTIALIGIPLSFVQAACARPAFEAFLEPKWYPAIPLLQVLSLGMGPRLLAGIADAVLKARGRFGLLLAFNWIAALLLAAALVITALLKGSALTVAITTSVWSALYGPAMVWIAIKEVGGGLRDLHAIFFGPLIVAFVGVGSAWILLSLPVVSGINPLLQLTLCLLTSLVYTLCLARVLCYPTMREIKGLVLDRFLHTR